MDVISSRIPVNYSSNEDSTVRLITRLKACSKYKDFEGGRKLHAEAVENGSDCNMYVASSLVNMYSRCGRMLEAQKAFDRMECRDVASWNALIFGYAENGESCKAFELFAMLVNSFQQRNCAPPNARSFLAVLKACSAEVFAGRKERVKILETVMAIHSQAVTCRWEFWIVVANALIDKYAVCGSMKDSQRVFDQMQRHDVVSWTALMSGYAENGQGETALIIFVRMVWNGCFPDARAYMAAFKACACLATREEFESLGADGRTVKVRALEKAMAVHALAGRALESEDMYVANTVLDVYAKCGSLDDASMVFQRMGGRLDVVSWNTVMLGYAENGQADKALQLFQAMLLNRKCVPNARTFVAALKACTRLACYQGEESKLQALEKGMGVHALASETGCDTAIFVVNSLVDMYGKCGSLVDARAAFDRVDAHDVVSWSTLILNYADNGDHETALQLFVRMNKKPDARTFLAALRACTSMATQKMTEALEVGMAIHSRARKLGFETNIFLANVLIDMYSKCGSMVDAHAAFQRMQTPDVVSWTSLLVGYVEGGQGEVALDMFAATSNNPTNARTFVAAIKACSCIAETEKGEVKMKALELGMALHSHAKTMSCHSQDMFLDNALVDMYSKCGSLVDAWMVFQRMNSPDVITWTSLILGYAENGEAERAMELFFSMECAPNSLTCAAAFKACGSLISLQAGKLVHALVWRYGVEVDDVLATCMVDLYGKCGCISQAQLVFESARGASKDLVAWTALISAHAHHTSLNSMFNVFHDMLDGGVIPNSVTLLTLLNACSHAGDVAKGRYCFEMMEERYMLIPEREHYHCMIDLLGRANQLEAALTMIQTMPYKPNAVTWTTLLACCTKWRNDIVGKISFQSLVDLDEKRAASYILMANMCGPDNSLTYEKAHASQVMNKPESPG